VPHSIVTVSLATAILPRLSASAEAGDDRGVARTLAPTLRTALAFVVPFAVLLPVLAAPAARVFWGYGAAKPDVDSYVVPMLLFGPGLAFFTVHYLLLRGFYAREENRGVFFIQCAVATTNIVAALVLVGLTSAEHTASALTVAYCLSYLVGATVSYVTLSRRLGGLRSRSLLRFLARLAIASVLALAVTWVVVRLVPGLSGSYGALVSAGQCAVIATVGLGVLVALARVMRITEVTEVVATFTRRLAR
jgi:putative peptidoglycan lipid II flippase